MKFTEITQIYVMDNGNPQNTNIKIHITLIPLSPKFLLYLTSYVLPKTHNHSEDWVIWLKYECQILNP